MVDGAGDGGRGLAGVGGEFADVEVGAGAVDEGREDLLGDAADVVGAGDRCSFLPHGFTR